MSSVVVFIVFLVVLFVAILAEMCSIKKRNRVWNTLTILYAVLASLAYSLIESKPIDFVLIAISMSSLLMLGWLIVRFEVMKNR